jgi:hypothetical protein
MATFVAKMKRKPHEFKLVNNRDNDDSSDYEDEINIYTV